MPLRAHPAAGIFPMMSESDLRALSDDIGQHGLRTPIVTIVEDAETLVLDGRNRDRACAMAGVAPTYIAYGGDDPYALVVSANLHRRHLTDGQRALIADQIATLRKGVHKSTDPPIGGSVDTAQDEAAALLNVSVRTVQRARVIRRLGVPELVAAVADGVLAVSPAAALARRPEKEQHRRLADGPEAIASWSNAARRKDSDKPESGRVPPVVRKGRTGGARPGPPRQDEKHEVVRQLSDEGFTVTDIVEQTGFEKSFVHHARSQFRKPKSVLGPAIEDAEVFAEFWLNRAEDTDPRWLRAPKEERDQLIEALSACCTSAKKMIRRLNKEAKGELSNETNHVETE